MIILPGQPGKDLCDRNLGLTRRDVLRVGGSSLLGMSLGAMFQAQAATAATRSEPAADGTGTSPGWGKAKSIIMIYLQGGPSHLDLWDPKENVPDNVRSEFKPIPTKIPGVQFTEILPRLAKINDRFTMIRSMSYTPNGLFNHTAAIYQMMTGYTTDKVSPSGQLEPPSPKDYPNFGSQLVRLKPVTVPMLPFVMLPRPLQESNVVGKGGHGRLPGPGLRSVHALSRRRRPGHGQDGPPADRRSEAAAGSLRHPAGAPRQARARRSTPACPTWKRPSAITS